MKTKILLGAILVALVMVMVSCESESDSPAKNPAWNSASPLHNVYTDNFFLGNIIRSAGIADLSGVRFNILKYHFNSATAENDMKPDYIAPSTKPSGDNWTGSYRFTDADKIVDAALAAGLKMHGHTLIWHEQTPAWLTEGTKEQVLANLEKYVTDVVTHFKDKGVTSWDVVNEAMRETSDITLAQAANWKDALRVNDSGWSKAIGFEYIEKAFLAAREADPDVLLYYNDYNMNNTGVTDLDVFVNPKAQAVYNMIKDINERYPNEGGRPLIDGIGMQSHHHIRTTPESVESSIKNFIELGLDIHISELDIIASDGGGINGYGSWNEKASQTQAERYALFFEIFKRYSDAISRVTFWGLDDGTSWRGANHAMLLDKDYGLKPAFFAVQNPDAYLP